MLNCFTLHFVMGMNNTVLILHFLKLFGEDSVCYKSQARIIQYNINTDIVEKIKIPTSNAFGVQNINLGSLLLHPLDTSISLFMNTI